MLWRALGRRLGHQEQTGLTREEELGRELDQGWVLAEVLFGLVTGQVEGL